MEVAAHQEAVSPLGADHPAKKENRPQRRSRKCALKRTSVAFVTNAGVTGE